MNYEYIQTSDLLGQSISISILEIGKFMLMMSGTIVSFRFLPESYPFGAYMLEYSFGTNHCSESTFEISVIGNDSNLTPINQKISLCKCSLIRHVLNNCAKWSKTNVFFSMVVTFAKNKKNPYIWYKLLNFDKLTFFLFFTGRLRPRYY